MKYLFTGEPYVNFDQAHIEAQTYRCRFSNIKVYAMENEIKVDEDFVIFKKKDAILLRKASGTHYFVVRFCTSFNFQTSLIVETTFLELETKIESPP